MKRLSLMLLVLVVLCGFSFATGQGEIPGTKEEIALSMGVFGDLESAYNEVKNSDGFKARFPKLTLTFQSSDFGGHHDRLITQIAAGVGANDIEALEIGYIARFVREGGFTDLSVAPFNGKQAGKDLVKFGMSNATTTDNKLVALPVDIAPAVFFYRKSVSDEMGVDLVGIKSWDDYIEKGKQLTIDKDGDGTIDQYALTNPMDVSMIPLNGGKGDWFKGQEPLEPARRFKEVLSLCKEIRDSGIDANFPSWSGEWINSFKEGIVVTMFSGAWLGGHLKNWMAPDTAGDWRVDYPPGKVFASYGGSYIGIPEQTKSENKPAAWEVVKYFCTSPDAQLITFKTTDAFPALVTVFDDPVMSEPVDFYGGQKVRLIFQDIGKNIPIQNVSEYDAIAVDIFNNAIKAVVDDGVPIDQAYNTAKQEIKNQM
ncbi:MAG: extracellular solute-binding protein [Spirochaetales bacterium]|nr:extracellular solute-binding protein [Spirochaetales bacterium]